MSSYQNSPTVKDLRDAASKGVPALIDDGSREIGEHTVVTSTWNNPRVLLVLGVVMVFVLVVSLTLGLVLPKSLEDRCTLTSTTKLCMEGLCYCCQSMQDLLVKEGQCICKGIPCATCK